jgi:DNA-binding NarL/FixJ family response regulator
MVLVCAEPEQMEVARLIRLLRRHARCLPLLVISRDKSSEHVRSCLEAGAHAYLTHEDALAELGMACATALRGGVHLSGAVAKALLPSKTTKPGMEHSATIPTTCLSTREKEVFALVGSGCGCKEIAGRLGISVKTVETHQLRMKLKLGIERSAELKRLAEKQAQNRAPVKGLSPRLSKALASA